MHELTTEAGRLLNALVHLRHQRNQQLCVLGAKLGKDLISTKGLSSTRIETEVNAGRVILLGVVKDEAEKQLALQAGAALLGQQA